jgi:UDP-glucose 4-epimerase
MPELTAITGGAGFIGSHLAEYLLTRACPVRLLDNFSTGKPGNIQELVSRHSAHLQVMEGDIRDQSLLKKVFQDVNTVFHLAAIPSVERSLKDPISCNEVNVMGTLNVLLAARDCGVERIIFSSSSHVYGDAKEQSQHEGMPLSPNSPYAVSKMVCEIYCRLFHELYQLKTCVLRLFNVFGPKQDPFSEYAAVVPCFITRMLAGTVPVVYGDGGQSRDFVHVSDVVEAFVAAAKADCDTSQVYNVGSGAGHTLHQLIQVLNELIGTEWVPLYSDARSVDVRHSQADIVKIRKALGYRPQTDFRRGLAETVTWYRRSNP